MSESRNSRRTRKTRKGVLGTLIYFHNHQVFCKVRTRRLLISHLYRRELYTLESSSDINFTPSNVSASIWCYQSVAHSSLIVQRSTSTYAIEYLLSIWRHQSVAHSSLIVQRSTSSQAIMGCVKFLAQCLTLWRIAGNV